MSTCASCRHYVPTDTGYGRGLGSCERWRYGYHVERKDVADNEVVVENDEGWGAYMGPNFGCVLHKATDKPPQDR